MSTRKFVLFIYIRCDYVKMPRCDCRNIQLRPIHRQLLYACFLTHPLTMKMNTKYKYLHRKWRDIIVIQYIIWGTDIHGHRRELHWYASGRIDHIHIDIGIQILMHLFCLVGFMIDTLAVLIDRWWLTCRMHTDQWSKIMQWNHDLRCCCCSSAFDLSRDKCWNADTIWNNIASMWSARLRMQPTQMCDG